MARKAETKEGKVDFALVTRVSFEEPRRFVTVTVGEDLEDPCGEWARGAFVRIQPRVEDEDEQVQEVRQVVLGMGAVAVRVLPRPRAEPLVEEAMVPSVRRESLREALLHVAGAVAARDRKALLERVERVAAKVGL